MAIKGNQAIPNGHFRKHWQTRVKCWFGQPMAKRRRANRRLKLARRVAPRPINKLRPVVRCPTMKYNAKVRLGRGFSFQELKAAGIPRKLAPTIGIAVDHRRRNRSAESLQANVQRLKEYRSRLILFPRNKKKIQPGESKPEEFSNATQFKGPVIMPVKHTWKAEKPRKITEAEKKFGAYAAIREAWKIARNIGKAKKNEKAAE